MKGLKILLLVAAGCLIAGSVQADIYEWTDANGVKHFSNFAPPDDARILMKTEEVPYDEAADLARMEADRQYQLQYQLEIAKQEVAAREAELERREAEVERKAAEAEDRVREADQYLNDAQNDRWYYRGGGYGYYRPPYIEHYKRKYRKKTHYGQSKKKYDKKYRRDKHAGHNKYRSPHSSRSRSRIHGGTYRVKARSRGNIGRNYSTRGSSVRRR